MIFIETTLVASLGTLILVCLVRVFLGPTTPDRVVGVDAINTLTAALLVVLGVVFRESIYVDVAIIYGMLSFVSTLYISKHMEEHPSCG